MRGIIIDNIRIIQYLWGQYYWIKSDAVVVGAGCLWLWVFIFRWYTLCFDIFVHARPVKSPNVPYGGGGRLSRIRVLEAKIERTTYH